MMDFRKPVILSDQVESSELELDPLTRKVVISRQRGEHDNRAYVDSVRQALSKEIGAPVEIPYSMMREVQQCCQNAMPEMTATITASFYFGRMDQPLCWRLIGIESGVANLAHYGLAIDIGTTTVVVYLVDMRSGKISAKASDYNAQIRLGDDILSRIMVAREADGLLQLQKLILGTLNRLVEEVCRAAGLSRTELSAACIGANTTMIHLLLGLDPATICRAPYIPSINSPEMIAAQEIGLLINPLAPVYCLPSIGSYIGGDIIAGILVSGMHKQQELSLFVDIGTNGEIVLGNSEWLVACAGAAGPALEGGVTECGMRAEPGAIDSVSIGPDFSLHYTTIDNAPARGICGSGLIDCLAEFFLSGLINRAAQFSDGRERFVLVEAEDVAQGQAIYLSQKDIDNLMRTKGAVNAALEVLVEGVGCSMEEIERFYAAGAFGQYLPIESAVSVGLYPDLPRERMVRLGNSSGEGARQVLLSNSKRKEAEEIASKITYFEMNANSTFMDKYSGSRFLPHTNLDFYPSVKAKLEVRYKAH